MQRASDERKKATGRTRGSAMNGRRPVVFLDIDGVLNTTKHNTQIHFEPHLVKRLKRIVETTDAIIVLTTFWRHFHEYITYALHRQGVDAGRHALPLPMGATGGKQPTKNLLRSHLTKQEEDGHCQHEAGGRDGELLNENGDGMIGRSAEDEKEYSSRAEEIEAWLKMYGEKYLRSADGPSDGSRCTTDDASSNQTYKFHSSDWKYVILDDRPSAAKPDTPLFDRFVFTDTKLGLTEEDVERAIKLLSFGP